MDWLLKLKVLVGLLVNAAYLAFCLVAGTYDAQQEAYTYRAQPAKRAPIHAVLAPPSSTPSKATTYYAQESDQLNVYLTNDLTLVRRPTHTLLLSPTFTVSGRASEPPRSVLLRFVSSSTVQYYDDHIRPSIIADGELKWPRNSYYDGYATPNASVRHSMTTDADGHVVETMGEEIPYEDFVDIISARQVIIGLGTDMVELTSDQVEALRDMHRHIPQQPPPAETGTSR